MSAEIRFCADPLRMRAAAILQAGHGRPVIPLRAPLLRESPEVVACAGAAA